MTDVFKFQARCPVAQCTNNRTVIHWVHSTCGSKMNITRYAQLVCDRGHSAHIKDWRFDCGAHNYAPGSMQGFFDAISLIGQVAATKDSSNAPFYYQWARDVVNNL
eukprot:TRINITY_DN12329_c0_g1_i1.p1 TRINITY_DN12329_c0_g1~~TRINITY_DN12329_c0_g1_i1.p1  ORF type:complete len:106 (-),score=9.20 TRINITY_DN12329_c0_g1_i1:280-597(-)